MTDFFISDTHFYHDKIIRYANRPFKNELEMNEVLIKNWNKRVKDDDTVYHLGDVGFFRSAQQMQDLMSELNGRKVLIKGNHDKFTKTQYKMAGFEAVTNIYNYPVYKSDDLEEWVDQWFTLTHKPMVLYPEGIVLCGHIHQQFYYQGNNLNMSVEMWGYQPVTVKEILSRIDWLRNNVYDTYNDMKMFAKDSTFNVGIHPPIPGE